MASIRSLTENASFALCAIVALLLLSSADAGLAQNKVPVHVQSTVAQNDATGRVYVLSLKDAIRGSQGHRLVENVLERPYIKFVIVTLGPKTAAGTIMDSTAFSFSIVYDSDKTPLSGAFINSGVQLCPASHVVDCARTSLAIIDDALQELRKSDPEVMGTLR